MRFSALVFAIAIVTMTLAADTGSVAMVCALMGIVSAAGAIVMTSLQSLISQRAAQGERGKVIGVYNSSGTFGRLIGTLASGVLFDVFSVHTPYWVCAFFMLLLLLLVWRIQRDWRPLSAETPVAPSA